MSYLVYVMSLCLFYNYYWCCVLILRDRRRWFLQGNLHIWFLIRESVVRRDINIDHQRGEWGTVAILAIALVLLTNTFVTYLVYGYFGNGVIGPFSVACVPPLILQSMSLVVYPLTISQILDKHRKCLREIGREKEFMTEELVEANTPLISLDDVNKVCNAFLKAFVTFVLI